MPTDPAHLQREFAFFAQVCAEYCPLYAALSARVAQDEPIRSLAADGPKRQPPANMLFGAVHYLLLTGVDHPLREYYPTIAGTRSPDQAYPVFRDFCQQFQPEILHLVATRLVQTNEVGRCGVLLPAFSSVFAEFNTPLHLLEVGASSGLNLFFDQYHYEYSNGHEAGPDSAARVVTELRGDLTPPLPTEMPPVIARTGIDLSPVDVMDDDSMRWLESLIWPDMVERLTLFRAARAIASQSPPHILTGDAMNLLPELFASVSEQALPCIFHCHAIYQMDKQWRTRFDSLLADLGQQRDFGHISLEWLGDDPGPMLHLETYRNGRPPQHALLAEAHHHGRWLRWRAST